MATREFTSFQIRLEHYVTVTHAIPPERMTPYLPEDLELDLLKGPEGENVALISVTCSLNRDLRWYPGEEAGLDFHHSTYRTYVRRGEEQAAYLLANYLEQGVSHGFGRLGIENTFDAEFDVFTSFESATLSYPRYYCEALSDGGDTIIEIESGGEEVQGLKPFGTGEEMTRFITHRPTTYFPMSGGLLGRMRVEHEEMHPVSGRLLAGQFDMWEELGVLRPEEFEQPYSVIIQPSVDLTGYPPSYVP